jgi:hypothetical protein
MLLNRFNALVDCPTEAGMFQYSFEPNIIFLFGRTWSGTNVLISYFQTFGAFDLANHLSATVIILGYMLSIFNSLVLTELGTCLMSMTGTFAFALFVNGPNPQMQWG